MTVNLKVCEDRNIYFENDDGISSDCNLGTTGEHNATVLQFSFFDELNGKLVSDFEKELVAVTSQGSFKYDLGGEDFRIPKEITTDTELSLQLKLYEGSTLVWKSMPHSFSFEQSIDDSGEHLENTLTPENWYERIEETWT